MVWEGEGRNSELHKRKLPLLTPIEKLSEPNVSPEGLCCRVGTERFGREVMDLPQLN